MHRTASKASKSSMAREERQRDPLDWEEDSFPPMRARRVEQAKMDPAKLAQMRAHAKKRLKEAMGEDPAMLNRRWKLHFSVTGIKNTTSHDWEVFMAVARSGEKDRGKNRNKLHAQFSFTRSYVVKAGQQKSFKRMEVVFDTTLECSYKGLMQGEVTIDVWLVSQSNFNQILGTARKSLYDMAKESVHQTMLVKPNQEMGASSYDVGIVYVNAVVSEVMEFTVVLSNWQFQPRPELQDWNSKKLLRIEMPTGPDEPRETFETAVAQGPRYCWPAAGQFLYNGTKVGLSMEAVMISVYSNGKLQGKAVVSLGVAGEYPIAMGNVKALSQNVQMFVQGRVGGSLTVTSRSLLIKEGTHDDDPSIPAPMQPPDSLVLFHLKPGEQYLVVELQGADGLPIADSDFGSSNPFARVKWDNMVQQSPVVEGSLSPTWAHTFYIPVRTTDEQIRTNPQFYRSLLPVEMASKGQLEIEIWHFDSVPTEFLGAFKLDLHQTRYGQEQMRAVCNSVVKTRQATGDAAKGEEEDGTMGISPALARKYPTKVYEGRREKLAGCWLQSVTRSTVSFECYFVPDFPADFKYPEQQDAGKGSEELFRGCYRRWDSIWLNFVEAYKAWFPDAPSGRRFPCSYSDASGQSVPLPRLVTPLALPASLASPLSLQHWIRCVEFYVPPRQRSCGQMANWTPPEDVLSLRRGSVQDHAVLLCCALLGLGKNAFVFKGTVQGGKEHAWVMSREQLGTVTFWETTTGAKYHLPARWTGDHTHGDDCKKKVQARWAARKLNPKWRELVPERQNLSRQQHLQKMDDLVHLPIAPWRELYDGVNVVAVPYETIEVVFNGVQLWGNLCNHHPTCIYFDMEDDAKSWAALVGEDLIPSMMVGKGVAIPVGPSVSKFTAESLQDSIEGEIKESVRMIRMRRGHESCFEEDVVLQETLESYLTFLEEECVLESDWCYDKQDKLVKPWSCPSPFNSFTYVQQCRGEWSNHWKKKQALIDARSYLPVKENYVLSGVPLHFSSTDLKEIRKNIMLCKPIQEYFNLKMDEALFFVVAKVFPMPSSVASVWVFLGAEIPLRPEEIMALAEEQMKTFMNQDPDAEEEEEKPAQDAEDKPKKKKKKGDWFNEK